MIVHNLTSGWRNILKYKTQNIISVLCIAVGVIILSITLYGLRIIYHNAGKTMLDDTRTSLYIYKNVNDSTMDVIPANDILALKSVKEIQLIGRKNFEYEQKSVSFAQNGKTYKTYMEVMYVNNTWLRENDYRSATTGEALPDLKPGTVLVTTYDRDMNFGKDYDPAGAQIEGTNQRISDVIYSSIAVDCSHGLLIVSDEKDIYQYDYDVIINDGFTRFDVKEEAERAFPNHSVSIRTGGQLFAITLFTLLMIFLGAAVLIIGLSGYLKMQLQLFQLRRRELALRRCHGAQTGQLFRLLCSELFIIFCFTVVTAVLLSVAIADYAMPILTKLGMTRWVYVDFPLFYSMEAWVVLFTFCFSILMAWLSVRRILKAPLSQTVGKSYQQKSRWAGAVQVLQFFTAMILFFLISISIYLTNKADNEYCLPESTSASYYKNIGYMWEMDNSRPGIFKQAAQLESVERVAMFTNRFWQLTDSQFDSTGLTEVIPRERLLNMTYYDDNDFYIYFTVVEPDIFPITKVTVHETDGSEEGLQGDDIRKAIFAYKDEAEAMRNKLGLSVIAPKEITFMDSLTYVCIGYANPLPSHKKGFNDNCFYILQGEKQIEALKERGKSIYAEHYLLQPKDGDFDAMAKEVNELCHRLIPAMPANFQFDMPSIYDQWYLSLQVITLVKQATLLLSLITLLCIILTVYSSVALETRSRQKEVAIRKVHGAKKRDIVKLFSRYYLVTLVIAFLLALAAVGGFISFISKDSSINPDDIFIFIGGFLASAAIITLVTILTVWSKIRKIANINATEYLRKE